jgi:hypothetical protein
MVPHVQSTLTHFLLHILRCFCWNVCESINVLVCKLKDLNITKSRFDLHDLPLYADSRYSYIAVVYWTVSRNSVRLL